MYNLLRAFTLATDLVQKAEEHQIDVSGARKVLGAVWVELPSFSSAVIVAAEQLYDDPNLAAGEGCDTEAEWLRAVIDEVGTPAADGETLGESDSWIAMVRGTAWLAFCLRQASAYAEDKLYGRVAFERIGATFSSADEFERAMVFATVNEAAVHLASTDSPSAHQVKAAYDELLEVVES